MAIFGLGKKNKKALEAPGSPVAQIMALKQQGMDNNQIIQEMEKQGYDSTQIFDVLNQVSMANPGVTPEPQPGYGTPQPDFSSQQFPDQPSEQLDFSSDKDQIEEIAEAIIDEKWKEFEEDVRVIINWKEKTEIRLNQLAQQIKDVTDSVKSLQNSIVNKITQYDRNLTDVGTEIKAMEKVFQKVLPNLTENVNKLERMAKSTKPSSSTKK